MNDSEKIMHVLLDGIIYNKPLDFNGLRLPDSVVEKLLKGIDEGRLGKLD